MPTLFASNPKARSDVADVSHTTTDPFDNDDDITTNKPTLITQLHASIPTGETFSLDHISVNGNPAPLLSAQPKGTYALGEHFILHPGEALRPSTGSVVSGTRELTLKGLNIEEMGGK